MSTSAGVQARGVLLGVDVSGLDDGGCALDDNVETCWFVESISVV